MSAFCAICTEESPDLVLRPLGRDGALVRVCPDCDTLHPRSGRYSFDGEGRTFGASAHLSDGRAPKDRPRVRR